MAEETRLTYTIPEVGKKLGIGRRQAYELAASGQLPIIRIGTRILVPRTALLRYLAQAEQDWEEGRRERRKAAGEAWGPLDSTG